MSGGTPAKPAALDPVYGVFFGLGEGVFFGLALGEVDGVGLVCTPLARGLLVMGTFGTATAFGFALAK